MRYLFGPVSRAFADDFLSGPRAEGSCLTFGSDPDCDVTLDPADTWDSFQSRFPEGWQPDFIALFLPYRTIPPCLWAAPVPLVGLAGDAHLLWHCYRHQLRRCELVLGDTLTAERLGREGHEHVRPCNLYGVSDSFCRRDEGEQVRDIDILFVGNFNTAVQHERLPMLGRLARLSDRYRVVLEGSAHGEAYRQLLGRARIVFNRGVRSEWNQRAGEALGGGALLFQEAGNREVSAVLGDRRECVFYTESNLEELLAYYLEHEEERAALAGAGRERVREFTFGALWGKAVDEIGKELGELRGRAPNSKSQSPNAKQIRNTNLQNLIASSDLVMEDLQLRTWQALNVEQVLDASLVGELERAVEGRPRSAVLHHALGLIRAWRAGQPTAAAASAFQQAWTCDPRHVLAGLNLGEILAAMGRKKEAVEQCERTLAMLERLPELEPALMDGARYPSFFDEFRVAWERAAWDNAGDERAEMEAKRVLLRWRLHMLLGEVSGDAVHFAEAALCRPDLAVSHAVLGHALARLPPAIVRAAEQLDPKDFLKLRKALERVEERLWDRELAEVTRKHKKDKLTDTKIDELVLKRRYRGRRA